MIRAEVNTAGTNGHINFEFIKFSRNSHDSASESFCKYRHSRFICFRENNHKFFSTISGNYITWSNSNFQLFCQGDQYLVARWMTVTVVNFFEKIYVKKNETEIFFIAMCSCCFCFENFLKISMVI